MPQACLVNWMRASGVTLFIDKPFKPARRSSCYNSRLQDVERNDRQREVAFGCRRSRSPSRGRSRSWRRSPWRGLGAGGDPANLAGPRRDADPSHCAGARRRRPVMKSSVLSFVCTALLPFLLDASGATPLLNA